MCWLLSFFLSDNLREVRCLTSRQVSHDLKILWLPSIPATAHWLKIAAFNEQLLAPLRNIPAMDQAPLAQEYSSGDTSLQARASMGLNSAESQQQIEDYFADVTPPPKKIVRKNVYCQRK